MYNIGVTTMSPRKFPFLIALLMLGFIISCDEEKPTYKIKVLCSADTARGYYFYDGGHVVTFSSALDSNNFSTMEVEFDAIIESDIRAYAVTATKDLAGVSLTIYLYKDGKVLQEVKGTKNATSLLYEASLVYTVTSTDDNTNTTTDTGSGT